MGVLPIVVPDMPEARSEIVPARLARKVAPLFGVPWPAGPFGHRTWVCDYNKVTLSEIARGAPLPSRAQGAWAKDAVTRGWAIVDRIGVSAPGATLPNVIPNATLNRFGPDTKAAVLLTAANRLLEPVTAAVRAALGMLAAAGGGPLPRRARTTAWAALVIEVFRTQPALVAAAIRARTVQRELLVDWHLPLAAPSASVALTRCEVSGPEPDEPRNPASCPRELDLVDGTVRLLGVAHPDEVADRLLRELIAIGTRRSSSHLWLSERVPDQLVVEALIPPTELVHRLVGQVAPLLDDEPDGEPVLPRVPAEAEVDTAPLLVRRSVLLSVLAVLRDLRFDAEQREQTRGVVVPELQRLAGLAARVLGSDDPARALIRCRVADMVVHTRRHDVRHDLAGPLAELMAAVERCVTLLDDGVLDRGGAAEAISSANVEINIVRRTNAARAGSTLPAPAELDAWLRGTWAAFRRAVQIDPALDAPDPPPAAAGTDGADDPRLPVGHHLHNYASYLATHPDNDADLRAAVDLFDHAVLPARELYWKRAHSFHPLRHSLQTASRATTTLSRRAAAAGDTESARHWAGVGYRWISRALAARESAELLSGTSEQAAHLCLLAAPALLAAVESGVPGAGAADVEHVARLLGIAERWVGRVTGGDESSYSRASELAELREWVAVLSSRPA
ncbi:MAG: hypothetical protein LC799_01075 [Actinobacteria bacterium]|nr:hypothetical protein [Actinomycetota bacterium]